MNYAFVAFDKIAEELGTGHVVRIERILHTIHLKKSTNFTTLISNNTNKSYADKSIIVSNLEAARIKILELIESRAFDVIVFDCLDYLNDLYPACKKKDIFTIGIDVSDSSSLDADLLINPSIFNKFSYLDGLPFAIHYEESKLKKFLNPNKKKESLFVCFGGLDYQKYLSNIFDHLKKLPQTLEINIVVSDKKDLKITDKLPKNIKLYFRPKNFFEILSRSSASIISGGILLQESTYLGVPAFVMPQYDHQLKLAKSLYDKGLCLGFSNFESDYGALTRKLESLISNPSYLNKISTKGRASSDGFGLKRILNILEIFEYQSWDSDFFNKEIFSITCKTYSKSLKRIMQKKLLKNNIDLIYFLCPISNQKGIENALRDGFIKVDERVTYLVEADNFHEFEYSNEILIEKSYLKHAEQLRKLSEEIQWKTRYTNDKNFEQSKIKDFYSGWVLKSIDGDLDDEVYHISINGEIKGFISIKKIGINFGSIGLVGVSPASQGQRLGLMLTQFAVRYMVDTLNCAAVQVVTQSDNIGASKTYEKIGFKITDQSTWLHKWV